LAKEERKDGYEDGQGNVSDDFYLSNSESEDDDLSIEQWKEKN
jgi:hypothetical protein